MPFTPYHLGPGLLFGLLLVSVIDFPTFLVANCIVDVEPLLVMLFRLDYPLHGFFHSFLGGTLVALALALMMTKIRDKLTPLLSFLKIEQKVSSKRILAAALSGVYLHILLDARLYTDIQPFYPVADNPFLTTGVLAGLDSYVFCIFSFFAAVIVYVIRLVFVWRKSRKN